MANYLVINSEGIAINCVEWDSVSDWSPPEGCSLRLQEEGDEFDHYRECKLHPVLGKFVATKFSETVPIPDWMSPNYRERVAKAAEIVPKDGVDVI